MEQNSILHTTLSLDSDIPLYAQLVGIIKRSITSGALKVGDLLPSEAELCRVYDISRNTVRQAIGALEEAGFEHYEVSGYAGPGRRCRHNLNYWTFGDYLAAGAGAHGKVTTQDGVVREVRHASPRKYMASVSETGSGIAERRAVESGDLPFEFMLNALRLTEGVPAELFEARTGLSLKVVEPILSDLRVQGLLAADKSVIRPTARGRAFLSDLQEAFL